MAGEYRPQHEPELCTFLPGFSELPRSKVSRFHPSSSTLLEEEPKADRVADFFTKLGYGRVEPYHRCPL